MTAIGDGAFRVRCTSKNGTSHVSLISELEMSISGLGEAYKNPYAFISGGLYDYKKGDITNGNERGVATSRDGETQVGYRDIDFGSTGSETINLPLFTLSDDEYVLQIWDGIPDDATSSLLLDDTYQKPSIWNVYQPETYQLKKRVTGLTDLYFVFKDKVHIKGFTFEPYNRAFKQNNVTEADNMYGDSFAIKDHAVENIGNNVSFIFNDMDFLEQGANKLTIFGSSPIEKNTILVRLEDANGTESQLIEFNQSDGYEERSFDIQNISGKKTITFIFLPGSNFNFGWFQFES